MCLIRPNGTLHLVTIFFTKIRIVKVPIQKIDSSVDERRAAQLKAWREARDQKLTDTALENLRNAANGTQNLFPFVLESFRAQATLGEVCGVLREVWGEYQADF